MPLPLTEQIKCDQCVGGCAPIRCTYCKISFCPSVAPLISCSICNECEPVCKNCNHFTSRYSNFVHKCVSCCAFLKLTFNTVIKNITNITVRQLLDPTNPNHAIHHDYENDNDNDNDDDDSNDDNDNDDDDDN